MSIAVRPTTPTRSTQNTPSFMREWRLLCCSNREPLGTNGFGLFIDLALIASFLRGWLIFFAAKKINQPRRKDAISAKSMNNPNPFVPKGSLLEQQSKRHSRMKLGVFCVLLVGVVGLTAMLIQGCKREQISEGPPPVDTNTVVMDTNTPPLEASNPPVVAPVVVPPPVNEHCG